MPNGFWVTLLSEWGSNGGHPGEAVELSVDRLLARRGWLADACRRHQVGLEWQEDLRKLVESNQAERRKIRTMIENPVTLDANEVAVRQSGGRFDRVLRDFQIRDLGKLLALDNGANFSVPGAGKTTVAYAAYDAERTAGRVDQMLVVAPISAFGAWQEGADECFPDTARPSIGTVGATVPEDVEVMLVNYHRLGNNYEELANWVRARPTLLLLDEAHRMKRGWDGSFGTACLNMAFLATRRDILTGTPAPQSPLDLIALFEFLWPGQANKILPQPALASPIPADAGAMIAKAIRPIFVRTKKSELGLQKPKWKVLEVEPDPLQADIYGALLDEYAGTMPFSMADRSKMARMGTIVMYLLEAATNPHLLSAGSYGEDDTFRHPPLDIPPGSRLWDLMQKYNTYETPVKFQQLAHMIKENAEQGKKTLVWTNFVRNIGALERMLKAYEPAAIYGGVPTDVSSPNAPVTREMELARFRDKSSGCMVLLANPAAMSEGVSLHHDTHDAIYLDRTFNAGQYLQSVDRIHRLGLEEGIETNVTFLITKGTIDEVVNERIKFKARSLGEMLDDSDIATMALPSDDDYGPAVDIQDLEALFKHLRGES